MGKRAKKALEGGFVCCDLAQYLFFKPGSDFAFRIWLGPHSNKLRVGQILKLGKKRFYSSHLLLYKFWSI